MKVYFRPMPGLTIVTVIALAILIALGTWQYQRLQWKTALLTDVEQIVEAPPLTSVRDVQEAIDVGDPVDFRRIELTADVIPNKTPFFVFTPSNRDVSWRVFRLFHANSMSFFAAQEIISDTARDGIDEPDVGAERLIGYVRLARKQRGAAKSTPEKNRWFGFNPMPKTHNWADHVLGGVNVAFYIDTVPGATRADALPPRRPNIRNNHFDYMLTWYGLAVVLFIIYLILHRRAGRLGFG